jgi:hypothetical protein
VREREREREREKVGERQRKFEGEGGDALRHCLVLSLLIIIKSITLIV